MKQAGRSENLALCRFTTATLQAYESLYSIPPLPSDHRYLGDQFNHLLPPPHVPGPRSNPPPPGSYQGGCGNPAKRDGARPSFGRTLREIPFWNDPGGFRQIFCSSAACPGPGFGADAHDHLAGCLRAPFSDHPFHSPGGGSGGTAESPS